VCSWEWEDDPDKLVRTPSCPRCDDVLAFGDIQNDSSVINVTVDLKHFEDKNLTLLRAQTSSADVYDVVLDKMESIQLITQCGRKAIVVFQDRYILGFHGGLECFRIGDSSEVFSTRNMWSKGLVSSAQHLPIITFVEKCSATPFPVPESVLSFIQTQSESMAKNQCDSMRVLWDLEHTDEVVQWGKYKTHPVLSILLDQSYCRWLQCNHPNNEYTSLIDNKHLLLHIQSTHRYTNYKAPDAPTESSKHLKAKLLVAEWVAEYGLLVGESQQVVVKCEYTYPPADYNNDDDLCRSDYMIFDVAVMTSHGHLLAAIEIIRFHPVDEIKQKKIQRLLPRGILVYEVKAEWVVAQTVPPTTSSFRQNCVGLWSGGI
jgi:hypothetical protein